MRIINLKLQAFGPFLDRIDIDFEKIGKKGLFLISGQTGAGKTTIFDAIAYALYGKSSGGDRDEKMLRFAAATPDIETFVELEFEYKDQIYKIFRVPKYQRYKKSGEGTTENGTKRVSLDLPNGDTITDQTLADRYIIELMGVDINQFTQIVMLAQGNFMKLLKSNNDEKEKLFRDIFFTQKYQQLEIDVKSKYSEFSKKKENSKTQYDEIVSNFDLTENQKEEFLEVKNRSVAEVLNFVSDVNKEISDKIAKISLEIKNNEKQIDEKKVLLDKVNFYLETKNKIEENRKELDIIKDEFENIKENYSKLKESEIDRDNLQIEITRLENELKRFEKLNKIIEDKNYILSEKENFEKKLSTENVKLEEFEKAKVQIEEFLEKNVKVEIELNKLDSTISLNNDKISKSEDLSSLIRDKIKLSSEKTLLVEELEKLKKDKDNKQQLYEDIDERYFYSMAGILAKDLKDDDPCPVCGSTHHPNKAHFTDEMVEKSDLETSKNAYESSKTLFDNHRNKIIEKENTIKFTEKEIEKLSKELDIENIDTLEQLTSETKEKAQEYKSKYKELVNILAETKKKLEEKNKLNNQLENISKEINLIEKTIIEKNTTIKNLEKLEKEELEILSGRDEDILLRELEDNKDKLTKLKKYIEETRSEYERINSTYNKIQNNLEIYNNQLDEKYNLDFNLETDKLNSLNDVIREQRAEFTSYTSILNNNNKQLDKLKYLSEEIEEIDKKYYEYQELNNVLSGQVRALEKISFESFVQMKYLDEILVESNKRFYKMTDGKYSLLRKEEADNLSSKFGLEFEVYDHHNVQKRNINTLSGGESFQAALSLALGLSDVIQMQKGGIKLNSMFVDEGFGTLDNETLSKVMSILSNISQYDKLIGIISHVDILKEQIDNKIIVEKTNEGYSRLTQQI